MSYASGKKPTYVATESDSARVRGQYTTPSEETPSERTPSTGCGQIRFDSADSIRPIPLRPYSDQPSAIRLMDRFSGEIPSWPRSQRGEIILCPSPLSRKKRSPQSRMLKGFSRPWSGSWAGRISATLSSTFQAPPTGFRPVRKPVVWPREFVAGVRLAQRRQASFNKGRPGTTAVPEGCP